MELFEIERFICIRMDLALNNLQWMKCHKTKPNQKLKLLPKKYKNIHLLVQQL